MTNEQLVSEIKNGVNVGENMAQLYEQLKKFIAMFARRYCGYAEQEDLEQEGYLALYDAVNGYDPAAGCQFTTYAGRWIAARMRQYAAKNRTVQIPVGAFTQLRKIQRLEQMYLSYLGRKPNEREIAGSLELSVEQVRWLQSTERLEKLRSLDCYVGEEEDTVLGDLISGAEDIESDLPDAEEYAQLQRILWPMVDGLPEEQSTVIKARYQQCVNWQQAGALIGGTVSQARNLEGRALRELRRTGHRLRGFLPEAMEAESYHGTGIGTFKRTWTSSTERVALELL